MASFPQLLLLVHGVFLEKAAGSCPPTLTRVKFSDGYSDKKRLETSSTPKYYFGFKSLDQENPPSNNFTLLCEQASTSEPLRIGVGLKLANGSKSFIPEATELVEMLVNDDSTIEDVDDLGCNGLYSTRLQRVGELLGFNSVIPEVSKLKFDECSTRWIEPTCNDGFCKCDTDPCKCDNGDSCGSVHASVNRLQVVLFTHATTTTTAFKTTTTAAASTTTTIQTTTTAAASTTTTIQDATTTLLKTIAQATTTTAAATTTTTTQAVFKKEAEATTTTTTNQLESPTGGTNGSSETPLLLVVAGIVVLLLSFFD